MDKCTREKVLHEVTNSLVAVRWKIPEDFLTYDHYLRVVMALDWTSSPGFPYLFNGSNNRQFFRLNEEGVPCPERLNYMWGLISLRLKERTADEIRIFIKPEPTSHKKLAIKRYRLISAVSVADQIIDHMLFDPLNKNLIEKNHLTPIKIGWTPLLGGWKQVPRGELVATDKSCFDWTVVGWMLQDEFEIRKRLCDNLTEQWVELAQWRYQKLFHEARFITSNGTILQQKFVGVMKSGCVNTISSNSIIQLIIHYRVAVELGMNIPFIWAMGDDVIQQDMDPEYFHRLDRYCILKEKTSHVEFAGFRFKGIRADPLYYGKHAFAILHQNERYIEDTADAYALLYHRSGRRAEIRKILLELKPDLVSEEYLDMIWDHAL